MKKKLLPLAMLAVRLDTDETTEAVFLGSAGLAETLVYPCYSRELNPLSFRACAPEKVEVIHPENLSSATVLNFNLYLEPSQHWVGLER